MQLLKTSAFEPATPEMAASRSHSCASRPKVFALSAPVFWFWLAALLLGPVVGARRYERAGTQPARKISTAMTPSFTSVPFLKIFAWLWDELGNRPSLERDGQSPIRLPFTN